MQISEIMTRDPVVAPPDTMLRVAARMMRDLDSGALASPAICRTRSTAGRWSSGPCASSAG